MSDEVIATVAVPLPVVALKRVGTLNDLPDPDACPKCGHVIRIGDWPTCHGDPKEHEDPHYFWHFA